jgi:hypothetical protein
MANTLTDYYMELPNFGEILDKQTGVVKEIKNGLALFALIILAAEIILLIALIVDPQSARLYVPYMMILVVFIVIAYFYDRYLTARSNNVKKLLKLEKSVTGYWWQFIHNHEDISLSVSKIRFDYNQLQFYLLGDSFSNDGRTIASWQSIACSVSNFSSPSFHYFWQGNIFLKDKIGETFTGVGVIHFPDFEPNKKITKGKGWFNSGNISDLKLSTPHKIEFIKCTEEETKTLEREDDKSKKLIMERYQKWKKKFRG